MLQHYIDTIISCKRTANCISTYNVLWAEHIDIAPQPMPFIRSKAASIPIEILHTNGPQHLKKPLYWSFTRRMQKNVGGRPTVCRINAGSWMNYYHVLFFIQSESMSANNIVNILLTKHLNALLHLIEFKRWNCSLNSIDTTLLQSLAGVAGI